MFHVGKWTSHARWGPHAAVATDDRLPFSWVTLVDVQGVGTSFVTSRSGVWGHSGQVPTEKRVWVLVGVAGHFQSGFLLQSGDGPVAGGGT